MKKRFAVCCCLLGCVAAITAQDITSLEKIGPVASFTRTQNGLTLTCRGNSQVQLTVLAPDLVRVRFVFRLGSLFFVRFRVISWIEFLPT